MLSDGPWRTYTVSRRDIARAQNRYLVMSLHQPRQLIWFLAYIPFALFAGWLIAHTWLWALAWAAGFIIFSPLIWLWAVLPQQVSRILRGQPALRRPMSYALTEEGFRLRTSVSDSLVRWHGFQDFWLGDDIVLLLPSARTFFIIPAEAVSAEDRDSIRTRLGGKSGRNWPRRDARRSG